MTDNINYVSLPDQSSGPPLSRGDKAMACLRSMVGHMNRDDFGDSEWSIEWQRLIEQAQDIVGSDIPPTPQEDINGA